MSYGRDKFILLRCKMEVATTIRALVQLYFQNASSGFFGREEPFFIFFEKIKNKINNHRASECKEREINKILSDFA